jgi:DNA-binding MurR/RpiR family transcriptional regulator
MQSLLNWAVSCQQKHRPDGAPWGKTSILERVFEQDTALIKQTLPLISREQFEQAVREIIRARSLYLIGEKSSFSLAYFLYYRMSRLGIRCKLLHFGGSTVFVELADLRKGDVLLAVGFRKIPREVCKAVQLARDKRAATITVTSQPARRWPSRMLFCMPTAAPKKRFNR